MLTLRCLQFETIGEKKFRKKTQIYSTVWVENPAKKKWSWSWLFGQVNFFWMSSGWIFWFFAGISRMQSSDEPFVVPEVIAWERGVGLNSLCRAVQFWPRQNFSDTTLVLYKHTSRSACLAKSLAEWSAAVLTSCTVRSGACCPSILARPCRINEEDSVSFFTMINQQKRSPWKYYRVPWNSKD